MAIGTLSTSVANDCPRPGCWSSYQTRASHPARELPAHLIPGNGRARVRDVFCQAAIQFGLLLGSKGEFSFAFASVRLSHKAMAISMRWLAGNLRNSARVFDSMP
jgi:hypothetical protein